MAEIKNYSLNLGPQHPAAHGVLRLVLELDGEVVQRADPHIGLAAPRRPKSWPSTRLSCNRCLTWTVLDYVSMMCNEHAYCLAIEKLLGIEVPAACAVHPCDVLGDHALAQPPDVAGFARQRLR
jgi:NADH-quinone oxidoreductase subunit D